MARTREATHARNKKSRPDRRFRNAQRERTTPELGSRASRTHRLPQETVEPGPRRTGNSIHTEDVRDSDSESTESETSETERKCRTFKLAELWLTRLNVASLPEEVEEQHAAAVFERKSLSPVAVPGSALLRLQATPPAEEQPGASGLHKEGALPALALNRAQTGPRAAPPARAAGLRRPYGAAVAGVLEGAIVKATASYRRRHELRPYLVRLFEQALPLGGFGIARKLRLLKDLILELSPDVWALIKVDAAFLDADRGGVPGAYGLPDDKTPPPQLEEVTSA